MWKIKEGTLGWSVYKRHLAGLVEWAAVTAGPFTTRLMAEAWLTHHLELMATEKARNLQAEQDASFYDENGVKQRAWCGKALPTVSEQHEQGNR